MLAEVGEPHSDQPDDGRAGRVDDGPPDVRVAQIVPRVVGDDLRSARDLEHLVESAAQQPIEDVVHVVDLIELAVERRRRQRNAELLFLRDIVEQIEGRPLGLVGADADALAAVDAQIGVDDGAAVADAYGFCGAALQAGGAALALFHVQRDRVPIPSGHF